MQAVNAHLHSRRAAIMRDPAPQEMVPYEPVVHCAQRDLRRERKYVRPWEGPPCGVEHGQDPEVRRLAREPRLVRVGHRSEVRAFRPESARGHVNRRGAHRAALSGRPWATPVGSSAVCKNKTT